MRALLLFLGLASLVFSQPVQVALDAHATKVNFTLGDVLHAVHGTFQLKEGDLWLDSPTGKAGGKLVVDSASGNSGGHARDSRMTKSILEAPLYPEITFIPDRINGAVSLAGHSEFKLHGQFTVHGAAHELTVNAKSDIEKGSLKAEARFDVPYVEWGIKNPSTLFLRVGETVQIEIDAVGRVFDRATEGHADQR